MKLSPDRRSLHINDSLALAGIPPETFDYRLGSRSDPNRPGDPGYIVRLIGQIVRVSLETVRIVQSLPQKVS